MLFILMMMKIVSIELFCALVAGFFPEGCGLGMGVSHVPPRFVKKKLAPPLIPSPVNLFPMNSGGGGQEKISEHMFKKSANALWTPTHPTSLLFG